MEEFRAAKVPPEMVPVFKKAEELISDFFTKVVYYPDKGRIEIDEERYMWVRASSLAQSFRGILEEVYGDRGTDQILYKFGKAVGQQEAREFHKKFDVQSPLEKLSAGPVYFSYSGWAFVDILPASAPSPDENYLLVYHHPSSFEAEFMSSGKKANRAICHINAGYSAGWCQESFSVPLEAREITCEAKGDQNCTFIMSHRNTMVRRLEMLEDLLSRGKKVEELRPEDLMVQ
jgi:predicted hydrocarbon binding protein